MNTIQQAHILLVDDNTDLLRLLEEQLRGAGYQNIRTVQNCAAALFVPCHRIVRTDGSLGGFRYGLEIKQSLLDREAE